MRSVKNKFSLLLNYLKYYKWQIVVQLICAVISGFGAVAAIVALQFAITSIQNDQLITTSIICGSILAFYCLNTFIQYFQYWLNAKMAQGISKKIRNDLFLKLNKLPIQYFDKNQTGDIMSRFVNDVNNVSIFMSDNFADLMAAIMWLIATGIAMIVISWQMSLITLVMFSGAILLVWWRIKKSLPYFDKLQKTLGNFTGFLEEKIAGQFVVDLFEQQEQVKKEFDNVHSELANLWEKAQKYSFYTYPLIESVVNIITVSTIAIGMAFVISGVDFVNIKELANTEAGAIGALTIFTLLSRNFISQLNQLPTIVNVATGMKVGLDRIDEIVQQEEEFHQFEKIAITISLDKNIKKIKDEKHHLVNPNIEFKNVEFEYIRDIPILKDISFNIKSGEFIGIVGPTGSGKSTIINLLTKLYEINAGDILIDGVSIKKVDKNSLRKNIAIVLQDTFFFSLSIKENIKLANPFVSDEEIIQACKQALCHDIIMQLPNGYDTVVANSENKLSKGQKQLIAIARAMISKANIVVLDEATSSVDVTTEIQVQKAMENLLADKTSILIAHRLSTVRNADKILVIKDGKLIESGNHNQLLKKDGFYAKLFNSQFDIID